MRDIDGGAVAYTDASRGVRLREKMVGFGGLWGREAKANTGILHFVQDDDFIRGFVQDDDFITGSVQDDGFII
jgi:hypothetical protein